MEKKKKGGTGLGQILLNVVILGVFSIVENWLLFYYESQLLPVIFGVLMVMMCCLLTINIYNCVRASIRHQGGAEDNRQVQAVLYKQLKAMRTDIPQSMQEELDALENKMNKQLEELKLNQLRSTKALMNRLDELSQMITASEGQEELETKLLGQLQEIQKQLSAVDTREGLIAVSEAGEESFEAEELPELEEEEGFEADGLPELEEEEGFEAEELPELEEEEGFEAEELPELEEEEGFEADGLPELEEEEGFEAEELPELEEEEASKTEEIAAILDGDPNRSLSADEIAALFSGVN